MNRLHEQVASDDYWKGPNASTKLLPLKTRTYDLLFAEALLASIDRAAAQLQRGDSHVREVRAGNVPQLNVLGGVLKVVEDMRTYPKKAPKRRPTDGSAAFGRVGQAMIDQLFFNGRQVSARLETEDGVVDIARRTLYFQNAPSGKQFLGKSSDLLGRGGNRYTADFLPFDIIGAVRSYETRSERVQTKTAYAALILPSGRRQESPLLDFGAWWDKLLPAPRTV